VTKALTYVEIDIPSFVPESPEAIQTWRFAMPTDYLPREIEAIPSIDSVDFSPARISLGENLGERADLRITLSDHLHIFNGESYDSGTFFSKWRARYGTRLNGRSLRWIQGTTGQALSDMPTRHFVVENTAGPSFGAKYTITAKDVLKQADGDRAQAPLLSNGFLIANITDSATSATLSPSGIGNAEYPASGHVAIGGEEMAAFTRSGDTLTLTRGQLGTTAVAHEAGDRVQLVLRYVGEDPADIIADLFENYAGVPSAYIPLAAWQTETDAFLQRLYTATIAEPTSVNKLISELVEQAALVVWWEPLTELIRLQVLRPISTDVATFSHANIIEGSIGIAEQPNTRISQVWTYFGQRNALKPLDEPDNFRSVQVTADLEAETDYGRAAIKKIFSRWIPFGGRLVAQRLNDIQLGRFVNPPRKFSFDVPRYGEGITEPMLGGGYRVEAWPITTVTGEPTNAPVQVTRLNPKADRYSVEAEEMLFDSIDPVDLTNRVIIIDSAINNVNLRTLHDQIYPDPTDQSPPIVVNCYVEEGVIVGSADNSAAFNVGDWPASVEINLYVRGRIQGRGGLGGNAATSTGYQAGYVDGFQGRVGLFVFRPINLILNQGSGQVFGGGGGGGGGRIKDGGKHAGSGGGGAGQLVGQPGAKGFGGDNTVGQPGTTEQGGNGGPNATGEAGPGGRGGDPGQAGANTNISGRTSLGGAAGSAIDGISFVTKTGSGDVRGPEVN
jgi:hypothetical protein